MSDRPILFSAPMVRALLDSRKTQTRRVLRPQPVVPFNTLPGYIEDEPGSVMEGFRVVDAGPTRRIRIADAGDRLWVREAWAPDPTDNAPLWRARGSAPFSPEDEPIRWRPSIHMPRWASRLTLTVTDVRVQRVQEISEADAIAEGIERDHGPQTRVWGWKDYGPEGISKRYYAAPCESFRTLWDSLNAKRGFGWDANPWVVALTFTVERRNIDA